MCIFLRAREISAALSRAASRAAEDRRYRDISLRSVKHVYFTSTGILLETTMGRSIEDLTPSPDPKRGGAAVQDSALEAECPYLHMLLTATQFSNGKRRKPCSLFMFASDGEWRVCLTDANTSHSLWVSSDTLAGLPRALEALLSLPSIPWRVKR